nr:zinc finger protein 26-like isoform X2 [Dermacentor andersoni]
MAEENTAGPPSPLNAENDTEPSTSDTGTKEASNVVEENFSQADLASVETPSTPRVSQDLNVVATAAVAAPIAKADGTGQDHPGSRRVGDDCGEVIGHSHDLETPPSTPMAGGARVCEGSAGSSPPHDVRVLRRRRPTCERLYDCEECAKSYVQRGRCLAVHRRRYTSECLFECPECDSHFVRRASLDRHLTLDHHKCRVCPATFPEISGLAAHLIAHSLDFM